MSSEILAPGNFKGKQTNSKWDSLMQQFKVLRERVLAQHRLLRTSLLTMRNMDARFEALRSMLVESGAIDEKRYQTIIDRNLGLRLREDSEKIENGDVVWVSYTANLEGNSEPITSDNMPIRVGSNSVVFEEALIGRQPNTKGVTYAAVYKTGKLKGKAMNFTIDIHQVKAQIAETENIGETDGGVEGDGESGVEADGSGYEERSGSESQLIQ